MRQVTRIRVGLCLLACSTSVMPAGCSFVFSEGPPSDLRGVQSFDCSTSYTPPVLDTVWTVMGLSMTAMLLGLSSALGNSHPERVALFGVGAVGIPLASAIYGYSSASGCRDAEAAMISRQAQKLATPPVPPPPVPSSPPSTPSPSSSPPAPPPTP